MTVVAKALLVAALCAAWPAGAATAVDSVPAQPPPRVATDAGDAPSVQRPVAVAPVSGEVVRAFEQPVGVYGPGHRGVDLAVGHEAPVRSAMAGTVRFAGPVAGQLWITVAHSGGIETTYGGVAPLVTAGDRVEIGQRLGTMLPGRQVLDWGARISRTYIDPLGLLAGWRVRLVAPAGG